MSYYLDTSVIVSLFLDEPRTAAAAALIDDPATPILITDLCSGEFSAAISTACRANRISRDDAISALADFDIWSRGAVERFTLTGEDMEDAIVLVRRFELKLLFPDALHVVACRRAGAILVSGDRRQADAARAIGLVVETLY